MKRWVLVGLVLACLGLGSAAWMASSQGSVPRGAVPVVRVAPASPRPSRPSGRAQPVDQVRQLGLVDPTWAVEQIFRIRNTGPATLHLSRAGTSCTCTTSQLSLREVPPGAEAEVTVRSELYDKEGPFHYSVRIGTDDPATPHLDFHLIGEAVPRLAALPATLDLGRIPRGKSATASTVVYSKVWDDFVIADGQLSDEGLQWQSTPLDPSERQRRGVKCGHRVTVTASGDRPEGPLQEWLDLTVIPGSVQDGSRTLRLPVEGRVPGVAVISGGSINKLGQVDLGIVPQDVGATKRLMLKVGGEHRQLNILRVEVEPDYLRASVRPAHPGKVDGFYRLEISVPADAPLCSHTAPETMGSVRVLTDHPEKPEIVALKVSFAVSER